MRVIENPSFELWENIVNNCEYATFFHTPTWANILEKTYPHFKIATKVFVFDDGTQVVLPLIESRSLKGILRTYYSMPFGLYGGVISDDRINQQKVNKIFKFLEGKCKFANTKIMGNPYYDYDLPGRYQVRDYFTHTINLNQGFEVIWGNYKRNTRWLVNRAKRDGVYVKPADTLEEYKEYFKIYQSVLEQLGEKATSRYEFVLFENVYKMAGVNARLWLVYYQDKVVGGTLAFYHKSHSVVWHAAFDKNYYKFGISDGLYNEVITDAIQNGFKVYDFNPSGGHEGGVKFKESFGAERRPFKLWHFESPGYKWSLRLRSLLPL